MNYKYVTSILAGIALFSFVGAIGCGSDNNNNTGGAAGAGGSGGAGGNGGNGGNGGSGMSDYAAFCQAKYDRSVKCMNQPGPTEIADCIAQEPCEDLFFRDGIIEGIHTCITTADCMTNTDTCYIEAAKAQMDTASSMAYGTACTNKLTECEMAMMGFSDNICFDYKLIKDNVLDGMAACFSLTCDKVFDCWKAEYDKAYMGCPGK